MPRKKKKKQRETYGDGSITPKLGPDGTQRFDRKGQPVWQVSVFLGEEQYVDANGKTRKRQKRVRRDYHGTLAGARKFKDDLADQYENVDLEAAEGSFEWTYKKWLTAMRNANIASAEVIKSYETRLGYMSKQFGGKAIIEITATDVDDAIAAIRTERNLSNTTLHKVFAVTKRVFDFAITRDWLVKNPCAAAMSPKEDEVTNRNSLSAADGAKLRSKLDESELEAYESFSAKEERQKLNGKSKGRSCVRGISGIASIIAIRIMLATGMRRGEVCGLVWGAVNFENGQICVRQSLTARVKVKTTKTESGIRRLAIDADTIAHLLKWKAFQAEALNKIMVDGACVSQDEDTPIVCNDLGNWLDPTNLGRWWDKYRQTIGFPTLKMHELRHTQATMLIGNGADIKTVAHRLGHKKETLTLSQYAHAIPANDKAAADLIGSLFGQPSNAGSGVKSFKRTA